MKLILILIELLIRFSFLNACYRMHAKYVGSIRKIAFATVKTIFSQLPTIKKCAFLKSDKNVGHESNIDCGSTFDVNSVFEYI